MEMKQFELRITWRSVLVELMGGLFVLIMTLGIVFWFLLPVLKNPDLLNRFFLFVFVVIAFMSGSFYLVYLALKFSYMLLVTGISDSKMMLTDQGIIYKMDEYGLTYYENRKLHTKKWTDIIDVGCFKQQDKKVKLLYKYQIKFTDGTAHEFDLRGTYPTKEFKVKVEEFWLFYNC